MTATVLEKHSGHTPLFASTWCSSAGSSGQVKISWADGSGVSNNWSILFSPPTTRQVAVGRWRSHKALIIWQQLLLLLLLQNSFLLGSLSCSLCLSTLLQIISCNTYRTSFAACPDASLLRILTSWIIQYISPCTTFRATEYSDIFWGDQMCLMCLYGLNFQHMGDFLCFHYRGSNDVTGLNVSYTCILITCAAHLLDHTGTVGRVSQLSIWDHSQVWLISKQPQHLSHQSLMVEVRIVSRIIKIPSIHTWLTAWEDYSNNLVHQWSGQMNTNLMIQNKARIYTSFTVFMALIWTVTRRNKWKIYFAKSKGFMKFWTWLTIPNHQSLCECEHCCISVLLSSSVTIWFFNITEKHSLPNSVQRQEISSPSRHV